MWLIAFLLIFSSSTAHEVITQIKKETAVVIEAKYPDGMPFSYELYEVYSPDSSTLPFVKGRTDKNGRIVFVPDRKGVWMVKAFSSDGHGFVKRVEIESLKNREEFSSDRFLKTVAGAVITGVLFFLIGIFLRRKR
ncbi:MAG: hypothetical protein Q9M89_07930 [Persephonella sp.]|nr:hypothetical protein [Persephonella sp.]